MRDRAGSVPGFQDDKCSNAMLKVSTFRHELTDVDWYQRRCRVGVKKPSART